MNSIRIRVVKLSEEFGVGQDRPFAVQISTDTLVWWTLNRFASSDEAVFHASNLEEYLRAHQLVRPTHILWSTKV